MSSPTTDTLNGTVKTPQGWLSSGRLQTAALALVLFVSTWLGFFQHVPRDAGDFALSAGITSMLINRAVAQHRPVDELFKESQKNGVATYFQKDTLDYLTFGTPLWQIMLCLGFALFGVSHPVAFVISSLTGAASVYLTYVLGRDMYDRRVGYLAAIFLSTSLFFVVLTRSVTGFTQLATLNVLSVLLFVYRGYRLGRPRALWLAVLMVALAFFNGYSQVFMVAPIVGLYWLWDVLAVRREWSVRTVLRGGTNERHWGLVHFVALGLGGIALFALMTLAWDGLLKAPYFTTLNYIYESRATRVGFWQTADWAARMESVRTFLNDMFVAIDPEFSLQGVHIDTVFLREPMVHPIVAALFLIGFVVMLRRRHTGDRLCLVWFSVSVFAVTQLAGFVNRHLAFAIPVVYLMAAVGTVRAYEYARGALARVHVPASGRIAAGTLAALIAYTGYYTFSNVFDVLYARMDGNIYRLYGQSQVADFIVANGEPKDSVVVLGDNYVTPYDAFYFYTRGRGYDAVSWWDGVVRGVVGDINVSPQTQNALRQWEQRTLAERRQIFYVLPVGAYYNEKPGWNLSVPTGTDLFQAVHGALAPEKRVYSTSGLPIFDIYRITRDTRRSWEARFGVSGKEGGTLRAAQSTAIRGLRISGPARNLQVRIGDDTLKTGMTLGPRSEAKLTFDQNSYIDIRPTLDPTWLNIEALEHYGVHVAAGPLTETSAVQHTGRKGLVLYRVEAPAPITRLEIRTNPRIYNDVPRLNRVTAYFSLDRAEFQPIYTVASDGSGRWGRYKNFHVGAMEGVYEYETYDVLFPASKVCYIAIALEGTPGQVQIISTLDRMHAMSFKAYFDGSGERRPTVQQGVNRLEFDKQLPGAATVTVLTNDFVTPSRTLDATVLHQANASVGSLVDDPAASLGRALVLSRRSVARAVTSPATTVASDDIYVALFRCRAPEEALNAKVSAPAMISVVGTGGTVLASRRVDRSELAGESYRTLSLFFAARGNRPLSLKLDWNGSGDLWLDHVEIEKVSGRLSTSQLTIPAQLFVEDRDALSPLASVGLRNVGRAGLFVRGTHSGPTGLAQQIEFTLKTDDNRVDREIAVARISAANGQRAQRLGIKGTDFVRNETYQVFSAGILPPPDLSNVRYDTGMPELQIEAARTPKVSIGRNDEPDKEARTGHARRSTAMHAQGHLMVAQGPALTKGTHIAAFRLKLEGLVKAPAMLIDVKRIKADGTVTVTPRTIEAAEFVQPGRYQNVYLEFETDETELVQYRALMFHNNADVSIDSVDVRKLSASTKERSPATEQLRFEVEYLGGASLYLNQVEISSSRRTAIYESEDTMHVNLGTDSIGDQDAHNAYARFSGQKHPQGHLVIVPTGVQPTPGRYRAVFWLKIGDNQGRHVVATLEALYERPQEVVTSLEVHADDFHRAGTYQPFSVEFEVPANLTVRQLQFRVLVHENAELWSDYVEYLPLTGQIGVMELDRPGARLVREGRALQPTLFVSATGPGWVELARSDPLSLEAGRYVAGVRLRSVESAVSPVTRGTVARLRVEFLDGVTPAVEREIPQESFGKPAGYELFTVPFEAAGPARVRLHVTYGGLSELSLDSLFVDLDPVGPLSSATSRVAR